MLRRRRSFGSAIITPLIPCSAANLSDRALVSGSHNCGCGFCSGCGKTCSSNEMTVYSKEQASRGRDLYAEHCASCHGMMLEGQSSLPLSGATFQARWADEKHSVGDLFYIVRTLMPYGQPATLSKREYIDIIAYVLMMNGYSSGTRALPLDPAVLDNITIKPQRP